jgi:2-amino-4-hydroxy-6-hydroxymethyldihydropteridine diphosphokinase
MGDVAYVALGSNVGDRAAYLSLGREGLAAIPRSRLRGVSSIEETEPLGPIPQGPYLNQMAALETELTPEELLEALQSIEERAGRVRGTRWGPRTLDLDIVRYGHRRIADPDLIIPHPGLSDRDFWIRELAELEAHER